MTRPHVTLKLATSLDGRIATGAGESRWITGPEARAQVQRMRAEAGAVLIGAGTARADDPELLARTEPRSQVQPLRVVLNSNLDLAPAGKLFGNFDQSALLIVGVQGVDPARRVALEAAGAKTALVKAGVGGGVDVQAALELLAAKHRIARVLSEGGGQLAASLIKAGVVDRIEWMRAPMILGEEGRPAIGALALARLSEVPAWRRVAVRELGPDLWESYERA